MNSVIHWSVSYDADAAVKYAIDNATATPEFSSDNGLGSDCANFVSKCINAGGIPIDNAGYDGYTIEYSQHSSSKQDKVYHTLSDSKTVTLYKPTV